MTSHKDYSGTPLSKKLGIKPGMRVAVLNAPSHFGSLLEPLPDGVTVTTAARGRPEVVVCFATRLSDLRRRCAPARRALVEDGGLWVAYPKKSSALATDITFAAAQELGLDAGLVDNKSCAIDDDWTALRFVYRRQDRGGRT